MSEEGAWQPCVNRVRCVFEARPKAHELKNWKRKVLMMSWSSCSVSVRWFSLSLSHFAILKYTMFITWGQQGRRGGGEWQVGVWQQWQ